MESKFEKEVMLYLRNLVNKMSYLTKSVDSLHNRIDVLESVLMDGFRATGTAFNQTKEVCQAIVNETRSVKDNLEEYGCIIEGSSYFDTRVV